MAICSGEGGPLAPAPAPVGPPAPAGAPLEGALIVYSVEECIYDNRQKSSVQYRREKGWPQGR